MSDQHYTTPSTSTSAMGLLMRTWWIFLGNGALVLVLALMAFERDALPSHLDLVFVALVVSLFAARFADIRYFEGETAEGVRATMAHFRSYAVRLMAGSATGWGAANALTLL